LTYKEKEEEEEKKKFESLSIVLLVSKF
jgi:hypothetical protein